MPRSRLASHAIPVQMTNERLQMTNERLDEKPVRADLTDRECARLLGATIGGLAGMTDRETLLRALRWWGGAQGETSVREIYRLQSEMG